MTARTQTRRVALSGLVASAVVVSACAGADGPGADADSGTVESLTIVLGDAPNSLDITKHFDIYNMGTMSLFTEPLERLHTDGSLSPNLATDVSQPDETTLVYTLRDDVQFSNGEPLTPDDVVWSIEHVIDAEAGAQTAAILTSVADVTATGDHEVTVTLEHPDPTAREVIALVALVHNAVFAEESGDELGNPTAVPIGTGAYQVTDYGTEAVTLTRNPHYWGEEPLADTLAISYIPTDDTAQLAMRSGEVHGALVKNPTTLPQWEAISGSTTYSSPTLISNFLALDTTSPPFDDIHVRKAIAHSIDREGLLQAAFGEEGSLLSALLPKELLYPIAPSEEAVDDFVDSLPSYGFDMEQAAAELAQSDHAEGFSVTIPYITGEAWSELTVLNLQENMRPMGVTVTPQAVTWQAWIAAVFGHETTEVWPMSWAAPTPDPGQLPRVVTESAMSDPGGYNFAKWAPDELVQAAVVLESSMEESARWEASQEVLSHIATDVPYVPLFQPHSIVVLADGFSFAADLGIMDIANGTWVALLESR